MGGAERWRADWALTMNGEPAADAEVVVENGRIAEVRSARPAGTDRVHDFEGCVLMPGLVNVHTHLDYTVMRGLLEEKEFFAWIRELTQRSRDFTNEDWLASAMIGAAEAVAGGVTSLGDCTPTGFAADAACAFSLGGVAYQEVFGIDPAEPVSEILARLHSSLQRLQGVCAGSRLKPGLSPHAPYTVREELMRALAGLAGQKQMPLCVHACESLAEMELMLRGQGPFAAMLQRRNIAWQAPGCGTVEFLEQCGILGPNTLLVHGVQVSAADRARMAKAGAAWAHCPKSNAKLGNGIAPLGLLGRRVGLGSDSVASNNTMDMFEEMRFGLLMQRAARRSIGAADARTMLQIATRGGAEALGMAEEAGVLMPGMRADLCVVSLQGLHSQPSYSPEHALVYSGRAADVVQTVAGGKAVYDASLSAHWEERFAGVDVAGWKQKLNNAAGKMRRWKAE